MDRAAYENQLTTDILASIENRGGKRLLTSIVLTGSLGRGEATYAQTEDGPVLKSDVEIALVYRPGCRRRAKRLIAEISGEFAEDLNLMPLSSRRMHHVLNFNYTAITPFFKTLFTYDLFNGSRTLWGRDYIGEQTVPLGWVDRYEGKKIVANRIAELTWREAHAPDDLQYRLWSAKLLLAVVTAWLLLEDEYVSSYHGQRDAVQAMTQRAVRLFGEDFLQDYSAAFVFLREDGSPWQPPAERLRGYVETINKCFEGRGMSRTKVNTFTRQCRLFLNYLSTGGGYGFSGFEDAINKELISGYISGGNITRTVEVWHQVLY